MSKETGQFRLYIEMLDRRSVRERALVLLTLLTLLIVGWYLLFLEPGLAERKKRMDEMVRIENEIAAINLEAKTAQMKANEDPNREGRQQIIELKAAISALDSQLEERLVDLLSPREMPVLLQQILKKQKGLRLKLLKNLRPEPLLQVAEGEDPPPGLYRHGVSMEMEGSYLSLLSYLQALEQMPNRVFWDNLSVETKAFPTAKIRLQIHTLSLTKEWIGV